MIAPEGCFAIAQAIDLTSSMLQIVQREFITSASATNVVGAGFNVPGDRVFILSAAMVAATAGAGQVVNNAAVRITGDPASPALELAVYPEGRLGTPDNSLRGDWTGQVWVPPGALVDIQAAFNAGANPNTVALRIYGLLIPRANITQG